MPIQKKWYYSAPPHDFKQKYMHKTLNVTKHDLKCICFSIQNNGVRIIVCTKTICKICNIYLRRIKMLKFVHEKSSEFNTWNKYLIIKLIYLPSTYLSYVSCKNCSEIHGNHSRIEHAKPVILIFQNLLTDSFIFAFLLPEYISHSSEKKKTQWPL